MDFDILCGIIRTFWCEGIFLFHSREFFLQVGLLMFTCMLNLWSLPCFDLNSLFMLWYRMLKYSPVVYLSLSCHHCEMFTFSNLKILFILRCSLPVSGVRLVQWIFRYACNSLLADEKQLLLFVYSVFLSTVCDEIGFYVLLIHAHSFYSHLIVWIHWNLPW